MKNSTVIAGFIALSLLTTPMLLSGCSSDTSASATSQPISVSVTPVVQGTLSQGPVFTGTVQPQQEVDVLPKIAGKVASLHVALGSHVKKGDILYQMDDKDLQNTVAQAQAAVASAEAGVKTAETQQNSTYNQAVSGAVQSKNGVISAQNGITQAQKAVSDAQNALVTTKQALDDATTNKSRYEQLYAAGACPKSQLDQVETAYVNAQAAYVDAQKAVQTTQDQVVTAQSALANASNGYQTAQQQIKVSQSNAGVQASQQVVQTAQAALKTAQDQLQDTTVTSPIDGVIGAKNIEEGDYINPAMTTSPTLVVANLDPAKVLIYVPADTINQVKEGTAVMVKLDAINQYVKGTVKTISPLDNQGKGYPVEVSVPNPQLLLKKGMVAQVSLIDSNAKQGLIVPTAAIENQNGKAYVFVADHGVAKRKEVQIGQQQGSQTLISQGLQPGDQVITNQLSLLQDQSKVITSSTNQ